MAAVCATTTLRGWTVSTVMTFITICLGDLQRDETAMLARVRNGMSPCLVLIYNYDGAHLLKHYYTVTECHMLYSSDIFLQGVSATITPRHATLTPPCTFWPARWVEECATTVSTTPWADSASSAHLSSTSTPTGTWETPISANVCLSPHNLFLLITWSVCCNLCGFYPLACFFPINSVLHSCCNSRFNFLQHSWWKQLKV